MHRYAILLNPGHNRVYYKESQKLSVSELSFASSYLSSNCADIKIETIANNVYCTFSTTESLDYNDLFVIGRLSFLFALFKIEDAGSTISLIPIKTPEASFVEDDITTILKYKGKTNELFTKLMVNICGLCAGAKEGDKLLDPMAGKGTTLFEGMTLGYNVCGIEQLKSSAHEGCVFTKKYLEQKRIKHISKSRTINNSARKQIGKAVSFEYAVSKEDFKAGNNKQFELIQGDAANADKYYKAKYFDMLIADLPYGVQHFGKTDKASRSPEQVLAASIPSWHKVLRVGGAAVFAFNTNTIKKATISDMLEKAEFEIISCEISFEHFVDNSIQRDIIIAKK